ncbi:phage-related protein, tail component [Escherichia coli PA7]|nr:phage-related protein, tail component [Escherichia coli PA7]
MPAGQGTLTLTFTVSSSGANNWTPTTSISDLLVVVMKNPQQVSVSAEFYNPERASEMTPFLLQKSER